MKWLKHLWLSRPFCRWSRIRPGDVVMLRSQGYAMRVAFTSGTMVKLTSEVLPGELVHTTVAMMMARSALQRNATTVNGRRVVTWL